MIVGVFFLLLGISILVKVFFKIDLPLLRVCFALFLVFWGVKMLTGGFGIRKMGAWDDGNAAIFSDAEFKPTNASTKSYSIAFGKGTVDLTKVPVDKEDVFVEVNTAFGEGVVLVDPEMLVKARSNAVFGEAKMPNGNAVAFGTLNYQSPSVESKTGGHTLHIHGNVAFGSLRVRAKENGA